MTGKNLNKELTYNLKTHNVKNDFYSFASIWE